MAFSSPFSINTLEISDEETFPSFTSTAEVPSLSNLSPLPSPAIELHEGIDLMKNNVENNDVDQNLAENLNLNKLSDEGEKTKA